MSDFNFSPTPALPDLSEGIYKLGDALSETLKARRQQAQFEAQQKLSREQEDRRWQSQQAQQDIQNRAASRLETQTNAKISQDQTKLRQEARGKIQAALASGNTQEAQSIAQETGIFDPNTGQTSYGKLTPGPMRDVGPEPTVQPPSARPADATAPTPSAPAPIAPAEVPQLSLKAPDALAPPPELAARMRARNRPSVLGATGHQVTDQRAAEGLAAEGYGQDVGAAVRHGREATIAANKPHNEEVFSYPARQAETRSIQRQFDASQQAIPEEHNKWLKEKRLAEQEVPYALQFGKEPPVTMDVQTQRYQARTLAANDFLSALPNNLTPMEQKAAQQAHAAILDGVPVKDAIQMFHKERVLGEQQGFKGEQGNLDRATRIKVAEIGATKPSFQIGEANLGHKVEEDARKRVEENIKVWLKGSGAEDMPAQLTNVDHTIAKINGNSREQRSAILDLLRGDIGKGSRLSQIEIRHFGVDSGLSSGDALANHLEEMWSGGQAEQAHALALEAAQHIKRTIQEKNRHLQEEGKRAFVEDPTYNGAQDYADALLSQRLPGYGRHPLEGAPPEVKAAGKRGKSARLTGLTDEQLKALAKQHGLDMGQ